MAEAVNVGKLVITISGDTTGLEAATRRIGKSLQDVDRSVQGTARTAVSSFTSLARSVLPAVTAAAAVTAAIRSFFAVIEQTTALDNLSQSTGISVQRLGELRAIALQTGIQFETLTQALTQFGPRMTEALAQPTSRGSQAMRALGIDVRDAAGNIRQLDDLLPDLADRFSRFADGSNKAAIAAALFGEEAGPRLIPLLNRGKEGLEELRRALGSTITQADIEDAREYQRAIGQLQLAFEAFFRELVRAAGPALTGILNSLTEIMRSVRDPWVAFDQNRKRVQDLQAEVAKAREELARLMASGQTRPAWDLFSVDEFAAARLKLRDAEEELNKALARQDELRDRLRENPFRTEVIPERPQAPALDPDALAKAQFAVEQWLAAASGQRTMLEDLNAAWQTHADIVAGAVERISAVQQSGAQREMAIARVRRQLNVQYEQQTISVARSVASAITALWPKQKGAAIAAAIINTAAGVTEALKLPFPLNWIQAAAVAASGAAQIATIRSTNKDGSGSEPSVGGGPATPATPETAPPGRAITIQGVDRAMWYSGAAVEELISAINMEVRNGATLISSGVRPT